MRFLEEVLEPVLLLLDKIPRRAFESAKHLLADQRSGKGFRAPTESKEAFALVVVCSWVHRDFLEEEDEWVFDSFLPRASKHFHSLDGVLTWVCKEARYAVEEVLNVAFGMGDDYTLEDRTFSKLTFVKDVLLRDYLCMSRKTRLQWFLRICASREGREAAAGLWLARALLPVQVGEWRSCAQRLSRLFHQSPDFTWARLAAQTSAGEAFCANRWSEEWVDAVGFGSESDRTAQGTLLLFALGLKGRSPSLHKSHRFLLDCDWKAQAYNKWAREQDCSRDLYRLVVLRPLSVAPGDLVILRSPRLLVRVTSLLMQVTLEEQETYYHYSYTRARVYCETMTGAVDEPMGSSHRKGDEVKFDGWRIERLVKD